MPNGALGKKHKNGSCNLNDISTTFCYDTHFYKYNVSSCTDFKKCILDDIPTQKALKRSGSAALLPFKAKSTYCLS